MSLSGDYTLSANFENYPVTISSQDDNDDETWVIRTTQDEIVIKLKCPEKLEWGARGEFTLKAPSESGAIRASFIEKEGTIEKISFLVTRQLKPGEIPQPFQDNTSCWNLTLRSSST